MTDHIGNPARSKLYSKEPSRNRQNGQDLRSQRYPECHQQCREGWQETGPYQAFVKGHRKVLKCYAEARYVSRFFALVSMPTCIQQPFQPWFSTLFCIIFLGLITRRNVSPPPRPLSFKYPKNQTTPCAGSYTFPSPEPLISTCGP